MILFENDSCLAVEKPAGMSMATRDGAAPRVVEALLLGTGLERAAGDFLMVHRLDVGTSGVVILARGVKAHRALSRLFQERRIVKKYRALVWGHLVPARGSISAPLSLDRADRRKMKVNPGGKEASTDYSTLERPTAIAHLELSPRTGRTHQIRVHLAWRGHPIVGDDLYGGPRWRGVREPGLRRALEGAGRLFLHALSLEFDDPITREPVRVESPEPAQFQELCQLARRPSPPAR